MRAPSSKNLRNNVLGTDLRSWINKIRLLTKKNKEPFSSLRQIIGFTPHNVQLYEQAFVHRSFAVAKGDKSFNNERLEFLGDAILSAVVGHMVYQKFPDKREGFLTNMRAKIVSRDSLNRVALELGLQDRMQISTKIHSHNNYMYGNALEALVGAIYLDLGYEKCRAFIERVLISKHINVEKLAHESVNFKSKLLEWSQKNRIEVEFRLVDTQTDEDCNPIFQTTLLIAGMEVSTASGYSKKESHQLAAQEALAKLRTDHALQTYIYRLRQQQKAQEAAQKAALVATPSTSEEDAHPSALQDEVVVGCH